MSFPTTHPEKLDTIPARIEVLSRWLGFARPLYHAAKCILVRQADFYERCVYPEETVDTIDISRVVSLLAARWLR